MMKWVFALLIVLSIICGAVTGKCGSITDAALSKGAEAVELGLYLMGGMCVWGGMMKIAERSGLTDKIARLFRPVAKLLFKSLDLNGRAFSLICMNITANLLGLGNAATPLGLAAMKQLEKEDGESDTASDNMTVFAVLNTASITLIPTTAAMLRLKHGSSSPMEILPCVIITSICALTASIVTALTLNAAKKERRG